ncbi:major histocompatibility complex class I-related protein [Labeo rohita]|uniref:Major histocompatibility complex class I-related protein n=1 Tax=Labeo rohita TaxID=84645 RepID=A0A498MMK3_LABRO|nr:major histocompatibility complex class I-related protein [Labeo rohita]
MNFIIFCVYIPLVHSELHTFITTYTGINGLTVAGIPEISSVTTLDGRQIDYYDSEIKKLIPRHDWTKEFASTEMWKNYTEIRERVQQTNKINISFLMKQFKQSHGVHTYQRLYGCDWDDKTGHSNYFDEHGYDGQDFISLDVENSRYNTAVTQGFSTMDRWNNDSAQLTNLRQYYRDECIGWVIYFLISKKVDLERRAPEVSLLQKDSSSLVLCHATSFYPSAVTITLLRNGQEHDEDVYLGKTLPNEDGTFQKTVIFNIPPHDWKKNQYVCVVEHMGKIIQKILTEDEIKSNNKDNVPPEEWKKHHYDCLVDHEGKIIQKILTKDKIKSNYELHTFMNTYTEINGQTVAGIPDFSAVTTLDGEQIDYYDSDMKKMILRQDWMKTFASTEMWKNYTEIRERVQQINKINISFLMKQFKQSHGVHTYQRLYGCDWDDKTGHSNYFDEHGYDGEDFISLDVKNSRYNTAVPQGFNTTARWNNDRAQLINLRRYRDECIGWIIYFLISKKKDSSSLVLCHATSFYPSAVTITWLKNGVEHHKDMYLAKTLPNEDGTFQKTVILNVPPHDWKKDQYICVVEHEGKIIQKILTENEIKSNNMSHTFMTTYTGINGQTVAGIPEFSAVTTLDGQQIDYYDSEIKKLISKQDWMRDYASTGMWKEDTEIRQYVHQIYKTNILRLMERFNQTHDVYTYQRMYGCEWDDQTGATEGFDQHGYNGEDFITLDIKELMYITAVPEALITMARWNTDRAQLDSLKEYYNNECVYWLNEFLKLRKEHLQRRAPEVSLLQKDSSSPVLCHTTGFYPSAVTITWLRNGQEHYEDVNFEETLVNEDGTFQKTVTLSIQPDEWENNQFVCVVDHEGKTIRKILTGDEIKRGFIVLIALVIAIALYCKVVIFFIYMPFVYSGFHSFMTTYTGIRGQNVPEIPEFSAVTKLDGHQIDYYDSITETLVPKQDWMEKFVSEDLWKEDTEIRRRMQQIYKRNIPILMERFNQTDVLGPEVSLLQKDSSSPVLCHATGFYPSAVTITWLRNKLVHNEDVDIGDLLPNEDGTFQKTVTLKVHPEEWMKNYYVCVVKHMGKTIQKILIEYEIKNNDSKLEGPTNVLIFVCLVITVFTVLVIYILVRIIQTNGRRTSMFLWCKTPIQDILAESEIKNNDKESVLYSVMSCHATGFYPSGVTITWLKNEQDYHEADVQSYTLNFLPFCWDQVQQLCFGLLAYYTKGIICEIKKLISRQDWMKEIASRDTWRRYTDIRERVQHTNKISITILMQRFNQSHGVHTYQRMYGCYRDDETGYSDGFDQHGYDGEDFISLDLKELRYITPVYQGVPTLMTWNKDRKQLDLLKQYYTNECIYWLNHFLTLREVDLKRKAPEVSLLQKDPSSSVVLCHATSFYPSAVTITWLRNGQEHDEDAYLGETLPNVDGTFQKTVPLNVPPEDWKKDQYVCLVEHEGKSIRTTLTKKNIKSNYAESLLSSGVSCYGFLPIRSDYYPVKKLDGKTMRRWILEIYYQMRMGPQNEWKKNWIGTSKPQINFGGGSFHTPVYWSFMKDTTITWLRNGEEHHEDVDPRELLPNEDGTFQKFPAFPVLPDEWMKNQYVPVMEHKGKTIQDIMAENEIKRNDKQRLPSVTTSSCHRAEDHSDFAVHFDNYTFLSNERVFTIMKFIIFFIYVPLVYTELHTFTNLYTEINGRTIAGIPEISSDWMKEFSASGDKWEEYIEIRERVQQINTINITILMQQLNHLHGVRTYQRMYGCDWDDKTNISHGFDQHGYNGDDFISLNVEYSMYLASVWRGVRTMIKWNDDKGQLELLKQYYGHECVDWLKYFLTLRKADLERRAPEVSVFQRNSSSPVVCHVTGFYPSEITITWLRNEEEHDEDVEIGDLLPNEDGTFQKTSTLNVTSEEWKKNEYFCLVEHEGNTVWMTKHELKSNYESHTFMTTYTGINGLTIAGIPEFSAVTTLDGRQIDYYDSDIKELIPRQDWMKEFSAIGDTWKEDTEIREQVQQIYKDNIHVLMGRFNQTRGVHTYQRMYGCVWDDETKDSQGFDQYSYDGEDFITLDVKDLRYISPVQQGIITVQKWNNDRAQLEFLQQYYRNECVDWLKKFLRLRKVDSDRRAPEVSLLQKNFSSLVSCHVTSFYPSAVTITWLRNGQEHDEDVEVGETLPNEDGTFQTTSTLNVHPNDWKNNQYVCVLAHAGNTIRKILTENEIKSNKRRHTFTTTYTEINGQMIAGIPEISSVTVLDGQQIDYYDSEIKKLIPRQDWMKEFASGDKWKEYTEIREQVQQNNTINITILMEQFNQLHVPEVSLLQEDSSSPVMCHATGFYPSGVTITWLRNGQDDYEDVDLGETVPNEDGTFQKIFTLYVNPEEWKKNQFVCVVEHKGKTIRIILSEDEIKSNKRSHTFITIYTEINGRTIAGIPEISSVTVLDGRQIDYYDSEIKKLIPRQDWMKEFASGDKWKEYTEIRERVQQNNTIKDSSSPVVCHATGFYPSGMTISWLINGQDHDEDVELGELLPNEDGTFQRTSTLNVPPDEWKKDQVILCTSFTATPLADVLVDYLFYILYVSPDNWKMNQYVCVAEHKGNTIEYIWSENVIKNNDIADAERQCAEVTSRPG